MNLAPRTLHDVSNRITWSLARDPRHPGGPGRLTPASALNASSSSTQPRSAGPILVRAGDVLSVEADSTTTSLRLTLAALEPGRMGDVIRVRAPLGTVPLRVLVLAAGRAQLAPSVPEADQR